MCRYIGGFGKALQKRESSLFAYVINTLFTWANSILIELGHEKMCLMSYANNKGADQPAHQCSLISRHGVLVLVLVLILTRELFSTQLYSVLSKNYEYNYSYLLEY